MRRRSMDISDSNSLRALSCPLARALSMHGSRKGSDSPLWRGSAVVDAVVFADAPARLFPLLARRTPAIQCLAAAALICPNPFRPAPLNYRDCYQTLVEGGIDPGDATWMMGLHHRDRLEHKCEQGEARLRYLEA